MDFDVSDVSEEVVTVRRRAPTLPLVDEDLIECTPRRFPTGTRPPSYSDGGSDGVPIVIDED